MQRDFLVVWFGKKETAKEALSPDLSRSSKPFYNHKQSTWPSVFHLTQERKSGSKENLREKNKILCTWAKFSWANGSPMRPPGTKARLSWCGAHGPAEATGGWATWAVTMKFHMSQGFQILTLLFFSMFASSAAFWYLREEGGKENILKLNLNFYTFKLQENHFCTPISAKDYHQSPLSKAENRGSPHFLHCCSQLL